MAWPVAAVFALSASSCGSGGGGGEKALDAPKALLVGGSVHVSGADYPDYLAGASITLTSSDGDVLEVVSSATGLFEFEDVREGGYVLVISMPGFNSHQAYVAVQAEEDQPILVSFGGGSNGSTPTYVDIGSVHLTEVSNAASVSPFGVELHSGELAVDGVAGRTIVYDKSSDGDLVVTFQRPIMNGGLPLLEDYETGAFLAATPNQGNTSFTFLAADLDNINVGGLIEGPLHYLHMENLISYAPITGANQSFSSEVRFRAVP